MAGKESGLMVEVTASSEKIFTNSSELNVTCQVEILKLLLVDHTLRPKLTWDFPQEEVEYLFAEVWGEGVYGMGHLPDAPSPPLPHQHSKMDEFTQTFSFDMS